LSDSLALGFHRRRSRVLSSCAPPPFVLFGSFGLGVDAPEKKSPFLPLAGSELVAFVASSVFGCPLLCIPASSSIDSGKLSPSRSCPVSSLLDFSGAARVGRVEIFLASAPPMRSLSDLVTIPIESWLIFGCQSAPAFSDECGS
jgi:hypothetical protein